MTNQTPLVVILAGGEGKRFKPFVTDKTLFPLLGKPVLAHMLGMVELVGVEEVLIATNEANEAWLSGYRPERLKIRTQRQDQPLGMADALIALEGEVGQRPMLVMNAVDFVDPGLLHQILEKGPGMQAVVAGKRMTSYFPGGYLMVEGDRARSIVEKPEPGSEPSDLVNLVFHYFSQPGAFLELIRRQDQTGDDVYERALAQLMAQGEVGYVAYDGFWAKLKYPHFVLEVMQVLLEHQNRGYVAGSAEVSPTAILEGDVFVDEGAKIYEYAVVKGPAYIGRNVVVGNHSLVLNSMVEAGSVIGAGSEVTRSYVGPECWLHHNFVGDSVLEARINPSYGTCFANLRLDKEPVRIRVEEQEIRTEREKLGSIVAAGLFAGVNCSFMPGTVVSPEVKVYPNSVVKGFVGTGAVVGHKPA